MSLDVQPRLQFFHFSGKKEAVKIILIPQGSNLRNKLYHENEFKKNLINRSKTPSS